MVGEDEYDRVLVGVREQLPDEPVDMPVVPSYPMSELLVTIVPGRTTTFGCMCQYQVWMPPPWSTTTPNPESHGMSGWPEATTTPGPAA